MDEKVTPVRALLGQRKTWLLLFLLILVGVPTLGLEVVIVYLAAKGRMTIEQAATVSLGTVAVAAFTAVALGWKHMSAMLAEDIAKIEAVSTKPIVSVSVASDLHETPAETPTAKRDAAT